jgi:hypothetical protein
MSNVNLRTSFDTEKAHVPFREFDAICPGINTERGKIMDAVASENPPETSQSPPSLPDKFKLCGNVANRPTFSFGGHVHDTTKKRSYYYTVHSTPFDV